MRLVHPERNKIEQGAIFCCLNVPYYEQWPCSGIVMTARCDLEHNKQSVVNLLPIIPFQAWIENDLCLLLAKDIKKKLSLSIHNFLRNKNADDFVLKTFPLKDIANKILTGKELTRILADCENLCTAEQILQTGVTGTKELQAIVKAAKGDCDGIISHLINQKLSEYYFLESVDVSGGGHAEGWVILLRHMRSISSRACY